MENDGLFQIWGGGKARALPWDGGGFLQRKTVSRSELIPQKRKREKEHVGRASQEKKAWKGVCVLQLEEATTGCGGTLCCFVSLGNTSRTAREPLKEREKSRKTSTGKTISSGRERFRKNLGWQ